MLKDRWVLAVSGTHGKTSTSSMLAWILEYAGFNPGYLIGGVPGNFDCSARLGASDFFVIEADEYDTAFFDKRSKFVHYRPSTLLINNLEYDHADIFANIDSVFKPILTSPLADIPPDPISCGTEPADKSFSILETLLCKILKRVSIS